MEVRLDPSLKIDPAELRSQFDTVQRLTEMQSAVNRALKSIDSLHEQIANTGKLAAGKSGWDELRKEIEKELDRVEDGLGQKPDAPRLESPPRLAENLRALAGGIDQVNAAATPYQMEVFNELRSDYDQQMAAANLLFDTALPRWNAALDKLGLPRLVR